MPLLVAEDVIGVLMVFHRKPNYFSAELLNLVKAIAGQVAVAINNAHLYELIRDQAERLGSMLRREQEDASRSQAILEAVADGVLVTGSNNRISFLNPSAEKILNLEAGRVIGQSLDVFGGLFGKSAGTWMETIRNWSDRPASTSRAIPTRNKWTWRMVVLSWCILRRSSCRTISWVRSPSSAILPMKWKWTG